MIENPKERVFHIDRECYLIYLGSSRNDYRPFLRIGNTRHLPDSIKKYISTVVVTDSYTGNPFLEHENLEIPLNGETRFVGDPAKIDRLKQFLHEQDLPVAEFEYETVEESPRKGKSFVFFFKNGNLHIHFNGFELFDLRIREVEDLHFIYVADRISTFMKSNPLRYPSRTFLSPGFVVQNGHAYLFNEGKLGTANLPAEYLLDLSLAGIEPDLLQWFIDENFGEGVLNRLKRAVSLKMELRIASSKKDLLRNAVNLFSGLGASLFAVEPDHNFQVYLGGFVFDLKNTPIDVRFPPPINLENTIPIGLSGGMQVLMDRLVNKGLSPRTRIVEGIPYVFPAQESFSPAILFRKYLLEPAKSYAEIGPEQDQEGWKRIVSQLMQIQTQVEKGSLLKPPFQALESIFGEKPITGPGASFLPFFQWNLEEFQRLFPTPEGLRWLKRIEKDRKEQYLLPKKKEGLSPLIGEIYLEAEKPFLLFRLEGILTSLKLLQAEKSFEGIENLKGSLNEEAFFATERERLLKFIETLHQVPPKRVKKRIPDEQEKNEKKAEIEQEKKGEMPAEELAHTIETKEQKKEQKIERQSGQAASGSLRLSEQKGISQRVSRPATDLHSTAAGSYAGRKGSSQRKRIFFKIGGIVLAGLVVLGVLLFVLSNLFHVSSRDVSSLLGTEDQPGTAVSDLSTNSELHTKDATEDAIPTDIAPSTQPLIDSDTSSVSSAAPSLPQEEGLFTAQIPEIGPIPISVLDVFYLVNEIAVNNGYRPLYSLNDLRPDPNWIYPENRFRMPDHTYYTVKTGDNLWIITTRYIEEEIKNGIETLKKYLGKDLKSSVSYEKRSELEKVFDSLEKDSHCKAFIEFLEKYRKEVIYK